MKPALRERLQSMMKADGNEYECVLSPAEVGEIVNELERFELSTPATAQFKIGDKVRKHTGDYQLAGEVRSVLTTHDGGPIRYVVAHDLAGIGGKGRILHIYAPQNLSAEKDRP